jgi:hypothetical protein
VAAEGFAPEMPVMAGTMQDLAGVSDRDPAGAVVEDGPGAVSTAGEWGAGRSLRFRRILRMN